MSHVITGCNDALYYRRYIHVYYRLSSPDEFLEPVDRTGFVRLYSHVAMMCS